jgi:hypothetical protein
MTEGSGAVATAPQPDLARSVQSGAHGHRWLLRGCHSLRRMRRTSGSEPMVSNRLQPDVMTSAAFVEAVKRWTMHDHLRPERRGVSIAAAIVAMLVVRGLFGWQQRRFADQLFRQLPDAVELVTSTVRSGLPVHEAFRTIARKMPQRCTGSESQIAQGLTYLVNTLSTVEFERNGCRLSQWRLLHVRAS